MRKVVCFLLALLVYSWDIRAENSPIVRVTHGVLRGSILTSLHGKPILTFRGVPYAKPPVGKLRFQPPVPSDPWDGVLNATEDGAVCPPSLEEAVFTKSEDCLFLNVYTTELPESRSNRKKPVIVFFHPGGWHSFTSHSRMYGPEHMLDQDIVLVTANYRLGVLGFLSTDDSVISGNYGLKDQVLVLRWVRQNIAAFGGDPNSVTLSGCSAGSASSMLHMVSPMSRGLFHRVIASSGSALTTWALQPNAFAYAQQLARLFNCSAETSQQIKDCLITKDAQEMADSIFRLTVWDGSPGVIFGPVIESATDQEPFLIEHPLKSFRSGNFAHVQIMMGVTRDELSWASYDILTNETLNQEFNTDFERILPYIFQYNTYPQQDHITRELRKLYFQDKPINNSTRGPLNEMFRDGLIIYAVDYAAKVLSSQIPVYFYQFAYPGRYSWVYIPDTTTPYGVVHMDDLIYLFNISAVFPSFNIGDPEIETLERITTLWANFARTGNPTPRKSQLLQNVAWEPFTTQNLKYMHINSNLQMKSGLYQNTLRVWEEQLFPGPHLGSANTKG